MMWHLRLLIWGPCLGPMMKGSGYEGANKVRSVLIRLWGATIDIVEDGDYILFEYHDEVVKGF